MDDGRQPSETKARGRWRPVIDRRPGRTLAVIIALLALGGAAGWWNHPAPADKPHFDQSTIFIELNAPGLDRRMSAYSYPPTLGQVLSEAGLKPSESSGFIRLEKPVRVVVGPKGSVRFKPLSGPAALAAGRKIDVNRASAEDLALLPGIGPTKAGRIVDDRARNGPYRSLADLERVHGVGPKTVAGIRPLAKAE